jgi:hypothetical protein
MRVHEEIIRLVVEGDDDDDDTIDTVDAKTAHKHLHLLKQSYLRHQGWDKSSKVYKELVNQLIAMPQFKNAAEFKGEKGTEKWNLKEKIDESDKFVPPLVWEFLDPKSLREICDVETEQSVLRMKGGVRRVVSTWGMDILGGDAVPAVPKIPAVHVNGGDGRKRDQMTLM